MMTDQHSGLEDEILLVLGDGWDEDNPAHQCAGLITTAVVVSGATGAPLDFDALEEVAHELYQEGDLPFMTRGDLIMALDVEVQAGTLVVVGRGLLSGSPEAYQVADIDEQG